MGFYSSSMQDTELQDRKKVCQSYICKYGYSFSEKLKKALQTIKPDLVNKSFSVLTY